MNKRIDMLGDLASVLATFLAARLLLSLLGLTLAGPITIVLSVGVASWRLARLGCGWTSLGLARRHSPLQLLGMVSAAVLVAFLAAGLVTNIIIKLLSWPAISYAHYGNLQGNLPRLVLLLIVAWTSAGFGEEMLFRGFVLTRIEIALGQTRLALILAVIFQAVLFGLAHYKQGPAGVLLTSVIGLIFGIFYAKFRNLWQLIIAHIAMDTVSLVAIYLGMK